MLPSTPHAEAGKRLQAERLRVRLSTREVAQLSHKIAELKKNPEYRISHAWLTEVENGKFMPGIFRLRSLSLVYGLPFDEIVAFFGIDIREAGKEQQLPLGLPRTCLIGPTREETRRAILAPLELRANVQLERTNLVSRMFQSWGEVPVELLRQMDWKNSLYGYIGLEDYTMYPFLRPGSFVEIDARQKRVKPGSWPNEYERPIYFVELRDSYICSWCEVDAGQLMLVPCPQSRGQVRHVRYPGDADIVGRVTAVTMRIADLREEPMR